MGKKVAWGPTGMGTKREDLASYVDLHQRASIMEEVLNNQAGQSDSARSSVSLCHPSFGIIDS